MSINTNLVIVIVKENYLTMKRIFLTHRLSASESDYVNNRKMFVSKRKCRQIASYGTGCLPDTPPSIFSYSLNIEEEDALNKIDQNSTNGMVCADS